MRVNGTEKATLEAAAARNGLALSTFLVQAGLDAAEHRGSGTALQRETLLFSDSSPSPVGNQIEELQSPRIWRFGARINF